jgi:hypothetical protein
VTAPSDALPRVPAPVAGASTPSLGFFLFIFWAIFAFSVVVAGSLTPLMFVGQDPDNLMRLVSVRDLVAGQNWFDLVQYRMDPPQGSLMHWSRLIDAPIAALMMVGDLFGIGERFALTLWPLTLLLGFMAGIMLSATWLGGQRAAVPTLVLSLFFLDPLLSFLPGDIDHHNAQLALLALALAAALRSGASPAAALAAGAVAALMLAIGLEMLPYVAGIGMFIALRWAVAEEEGTSAAAFGAAFAIGVAALYAGTASPEARFACDSLSLAFVSPAATAGLGLAALALFLRGGGGAVLRLAGLVALGLSAAAGFLLVAPECLAGPYGIVSPELKALWLDGIVEALPLPAYFAREPVGTIATLGPTLVALALILRRLWHALRPDTGASGRDLSSPHWGEGGFERREKPGEGAGASSFWALRDWLLPLAILVTALALGLYQVRTLRYANAVAIPILGIWLADLAVRHAITGLFPLRRALPFIGGALLSLQLTYLAIGWASVEALSIVSGGRIGPSARPGPALEIGLSDEERNCLDPASASLLAAIPKGALLAPVFYGPALLALSQHSVIAGPYHRSGQAILDTIHAMRSAPEEARAILAARGVDAVAICATSREAAVTMGKAPDGLLARLLADRGPPWLEPVAGQGGTQLRLWRMRD